MNYQGDTLKCLITGRVLGDGRFKSPDMKKPQKIFIEHIREYYISETNTTYRAVIKPNNTPVFLPVIEKGKIALYEEQVDSSMPGINGGIGFHSFKTNWFVSKGTITVDDLKRHRKEKVANLIRDNKAVYDKFMLDNDFSDEALRNIIHLYNTGKPLQKSI